jgi:nucleolar protein 9
MILEIEAGIDQSDMPNSIMDKILEGLISATRAHLSTVYCALLNTSALDAESLPSRSESDFLASLLRDPTSSHLCETLISRAPARVFDILWPVYFLGKVPQLTVHPIANFVLARVLARCSPSQLKEACDELHQVAKKAISKQNALPQPL